ncbi:MAG TPA: MobF family relaxase, partial [Acidimicrobiales bacterium]|nr:MobF family relaxase [Acidimicrobiales bacterium]
MAKMAPDGWAYYAREVAAGSEDYFVGHGEEPGRWIGAGCEAIGVAGIADEEGLARLFGGGRHPVCGIPLGRPFDPARSGSVAGYALSFSPPKSVSVLWALADPEITREVRGAHDAAVSVALSFLEEHAAFTRRGHGGLIQEDTSGLLAAAFVHRTSRAGDPQLHTHVLVANKVRAASDSVWLALDGRELFEVQKAAGLVYKAGLRAELTSRLGVCWTQIDVDGAAEIVGVPEELTAHFSKRRGQVTALAAGLVAEREEVLGRSLTSPERAVIHQLAAYQSRAAKSRSGESTAELRSRWRAEATAVAGDPEAWIAALANRHEPTPLRAVPRRPGAADDPARRIISALEQAHSTWGRSDLIEALAVHVVPPAAGTADDVRRLLEVAADHILAQQEVVALDSLSPLDVGGHETRRDGMAPTSRHGGRRYSTW